MSETKLRKTWLAPPMRNDKVLECYIFSLALFLASLRWLFITSSASVNGTSSCWVNSGAKTSLKIQVGQADLEWGTNRLSIPKNMIGLFDEEKREESQKRPKD
jgi:hypothetical protein